MYNFLNDEYWQLKGWGGGSGNRLFLETDNSRGQRVGMKWSGFMGVSAEKSQKVEGED